MYMIVDWKRESMLYLERTINLVRFELMIDYYACQSNFHWVSILRMTVFSRTCFIPCWDYIETCTDMKMIEALGYPLEPKSLPFMMHIPLVNPIELKIAIFFHKHYQKNLELKRKTSFSNLILRTSRACFEFWWVYEG